MLKLLHDCCSTKLRSMTIRDTDNNNREYDKDVYVLSNSYRIGLEQLCKLLECDRASRMIYALFVTILDCNSNVIHLSRADICRYTGFSKATVTVGLNTLKEQKLIVETVKNEFVIPLDTAYKGNLTKMMEQALEAEKLEQQIQESQQDDCMQLLSRLKFKKSTK
jgi:hypothetical protein